MSQFYVYEHIRPDTGKVFYVGKGKGTRAYCFTQRNLHYQNIAKLLSKLGLSIDVRMVQGTLTEELAFNLERERISYWREQGNKLCNLTNGGEGNSGVVFSVERKRKISISKLGKKRSEETRQKLSLALQGRKHSEEMKNKISQGLTGHKRSDETKHRMSLANIGNKYALGHKHSEESKKKMSLSKLGFKHSEETKRKISLTKLKQQEAQV